MIKMSDLQRILDAQDILASLRTMQAISPRPGREVDIASVERLVKKCIGLLAAEHPIDMDK